MSRRGKAGTIMITQKGNSEKSITVSFGREGRLNEKKELDTEIFIKLYTKFRNNQLGELKGAPLSVFLCLALHMNQEGECWPSNGLIMKETGYKRESIIEAKKFLVDKGYLHMKQTRWTKKLIQKRYPQDPERQRRLMGKIGTWATPTYTVFPENVEGIGSSPRAVLTDADQTRRGSDPTRLNPDAKKNQGFELDPCFEAEPGGEGGAEIPNNREQQDRLHDTTEPPTPHSANGKNQKQKSKDAVNVNCNHLGLNCLQKECQHVESCEIYAIAIYHKQKFADLYDMKALTESRKIIIGNSLTNWTVKDLERAINGARRDEYACGETDRAGFMARPEWLFAKPERIEEYINMKNGKNEWSKGDIIRRRLMEEMDERDRKDSESGLIELEELKKPSHDDNVENEEEPIDPVFDENGVMLDVGMWLITEKIYTPRDAKRGQLSLNEYAEIVQNDNEFNGLQLKEVLKKITDKIGKEISI